MMITRCVFNRLAQAVWASQGSFLGLVLLVAMVAAGCAHSGKHEAEAIPAPMGGLPAPDVPLFLNGPVALLLTNAEGFRARVVLEGQTSPNPGGVVAGELMSCRGNLLFAPEPSAAGDKKAHAEDFSYIWDVAAGRGYMLNGPLQGYAPISSSHRFTNVVVSAAGQGLSSERIAGHPCQQAEVTVTSNEGAATVLHVWRATDLKGIPVRITFTADGKLVTLTLSKLRMEAPPGDLFLPPGGFTKYASAEGMVNELATRQHNLKHKREYEGPISDEVGFRDSHAPARTQ